MVVKRRRLLRCEEYIMADRADRKTLGRRGEDTACRALKKDKYTIIEKNWRCRLGEIDIIARDKNKVLCFIEVKAKSSGSFGYPEEAVTLWKQKKLLSAAYSYMESKKLQAGDVRFDVVSVDLAKNESRIIKNAFDETP